MALAAVSRGFSRVANFVGRTRVNIAQEAFRMRDPSASASFHQNRSMEKFHSEQRWWGGIYSRALVTGSCRGIFISLTFVYATLGFFGSSPAEGGFKQLRSMVPLLATVLLTYGVITALLTTLRLLTASTFKEKERERELWECDNYLEGEQEEMVELYEGKGLSKEDASTVVEILSRDKTVFVDLMMVEELGFAKEDECDGVNHPAHSAILIGSTFAAGMLPLMGLMGSDPTEMSITLWYSGLLFAEGLLQGMVVTGAHLITGSAPVAKCGVLMVAVGALAQAFAYYGATFAASYFSITK